jgi:hypothetical protein
LRPPLTIWTLACNCGAMAVTPSTWRSIAIASRIVSRPRSATAPPFSSSGTGNTMAMLEPSELIAPMTDTCAPDPTATASTTANTPMLTPRVVSIERIRFTRSAVRAIPRLKAARLAAFRKREVMA